ncbi:outer membrane lipoprotein carrier protein LolA [bacterium]|nr:outer membrane lipoprotein carrier protein LolA [bacterium]
MRFLFVCALFFLGHLNSIASNPPSPSDATIEEVQRAWDQIKSYQADFHQIIRSKTLGTQEETQGTLSVLKPLKLRWECPLSGTLQILNGKELWQIKKSKRRKRLQVEHYTDISQQIDLRTLTFLADQANIVNSYKYQVLSSSKDRLVLALMPKTGGEETLLAEILKPGYLLGALKMESSGSETRITFKNIRTNIPLKDSWFKYQASPDDVVHEHKR